MVQGVILKLFILNIGSVIMLLNVPGGGGRGTRFAVYDTACLL